MKDILKNKRRCFYNENCKDKVYLHTKSYCLKRLKDYEEIKLVSERLEKIIKGEIKI